MFTVTDPFDYDAALLACAAGDRDALKILYGREGRYLLGVALRIVRQRQLAEDVVHDAFIRIWDKAHSFDPARGAGRGWIYSVVRHQALNAVRARAHEVAADEEAIEQFLYEGAPSAEVDGGDAFELQASMGKLHECLGHLDGAKRASILFAYVDGCSHSEIAQRLKAPLGSVKAWIKRGLSALRECMG